jgi:hypothetical protein
MKKNGPIKTIVKALKYSLLSSITLDRFGPNVEILQGLLSDSEPIT